MALAWPGSHVAPRLRHGTDRTRRICARWCVLGRYLLLRRIAEVPADQAPADTEAFDDLFRRYERPIFGYLWRMTGDRALASDLCQETFLRAWQHIKKLATYQDPLGWLFRVATHLAVDAQRARQRRLRHLLAVGDEDEPAGPDPTDGVAGRDLVHHILQRLSPRTRAALVLREVYGLSLDDVARTLGASPVATKKLLSRAREQFRQAYLREGGEP
jgi:RNA polymerase sigma-70 factor (ECF subfamily)